jgi:hypothetical protein
MGLKWAIFTLFCFFITNFAFQTSFSRISPKNHELLATILYCCCAVGVPANTRTVVGWRLYCVGCPVAAFIPAVVCIPAVVAVMLLMSTLLLLVAGVITAPCVNAVVCISAVAGIALVSGVLTVAGLPAISGISGVVA